MRARLREVVVASELSGRWVPEGAQRRGASVSQPRGMASQGAWQQQHWAGDSSIGFEGADVGTSNAANDCWSTSIVMRSARHMRIHSTSAGERAFMIPKRSTQRRRNAVRERFSVVG